MKYVVFAYLGAVALLSLFAFAAYGFDKRRARTGGRRIPEKSLHLLALAGGWPGAIAGQRTFRHKTYKRGFRVLFWCTVLVHLAVVGSTLYLARESF